MHAIRRVALVLLLASLPVAAQRGAPADGLGPLASGGELIPEQACYEVLHYELSLNVDPAARSINGQVVMTAEGRAESPRVALDLDPHLSVHAVEVNGEEAEWEHSRRRIWIDVPGGIAPGAELTVLVEYGGVPRVAPNPPWDGGFTWSKTRSGSPWIATSCQGQGADLWWPCKDHPSDKPETMDLFVTVPAELVCASNGTLREVIELDGEHTTYHWKLANPISNYNVALNIAPYEVLEHDYESVTGERFPVKFWVLPESVERAREALPHFVDHLRFYEEVCGPYPFRNEKYGIVETPHLGMEHQTIIAYGNGFRLDDDGYDWLHHHELGHEWWANLVTCRDWKDMWIHEGICTYMQALYMERTRGHDALVRAVAGDRRGIRNRKPVAPRETQDTHQIYFSLGGNDIYNKGALVMHALRYLVGDDAFFVLLRRMCYPTPELEEVLDGSQVRFVDTDDIRAIAEEHSGRKLDWFFDVYVHQPALPELVVEREGDELRLSWETPDDLPFPMPVPVVIEGETRRVELEGGAATIEVPAGTAVDVDPEGWVLRK
jgi:aminopeptidase N